MSKRRYLHTPRNRDSGEGSRRSWVPPPHYGEGYPPVPLWEKRFCADECGIPWWRVCSGKEMAACTRNVELWNDLGAREAFDNAKARFHAKYHNRPCTIPYPDADLYIQEVDFDEIVDKKLIADLDNTQRVVPRSNNTETNSSWQNITGWGDSDEKAEQPSSGGWRAWVDHPFAGNRLDEVDVKAEQPFSEGWHGWADEPSAGNGLDEVDAEAEQSRSNGWDAWAENPLKLRSLVRNYASNQWVQHRSWGRGRDDYWFDRHQQSDTNRWNQKTNELPRTDGRKQKCRRIDRGCRRDHAWVGYTNVGRS